MPDETPMSPDAARAILAVERQTRAQQCWQAVQAALASHRCQLVARVVVTDDGRLAARVEIAAGE